jgi:hypothetical protein
MKVTGNHTEKIEIEIGEDTIGRELISWASDRLGVDDDAGCNWFTDTQGNIYIASREWQVGFNDLATAALVDAGNLLILGYTLKFSDKEDA